MLRTTLLGSLLDVARHNLARGAERPRAVRVRRASTCATGAGPLRRRAPRARRAARRGDRAARAAWRDGGAAAPRTSTRQGRSLEALLGALARRRGAPSRRSAPFLHPGPRRRDPAPATTTLGWLGELHPLVAATWDLDAPAAVFEIDLGSAVAARRRTPRPTSDLTTFPGRAPGPRGDRRRATCPRTGCVDGRARGGRRAAAPTPSVFDLYRGEQVGEGRKLLALRLEFRAADRTLTDEEVARAARADRARAGSASWAVSCVAEPRVA